MINPIPTCSVTALDARREFTVSLTFRPDDPFELTEIAFDPEPRDDALVMELIVQVMVRAGVWGSGYSEGAASDARVLPFRMPVFSADRESR